MIQQLQQLVSVTREEDILNPVDRDALIDVGYADKVNEFSFITANGIIVLHNLKFL